MSFTLHNRTISAWMVGSHSLINDYNENSQGDKAGLLLFRLEVKTKSVKSGLSRLNRGCGQSERKIVCATWKRLAVHMCGYRICDKLCKSYSTSILDASELFWNKDLHRQLVMERQNLTDSLATQIMYKHDVFLTSGPPSITAWEE